MERLCDNYGLPFRKPEKFPANSLLATRVAMLGHGQAWLPDFARAIFHANFASGGDISDPELVSEILSAVAQPAEELIEQANGDDAKKLLREQTDRAATLGIFGAPTFTVEGELFWGNDRMGDAMVWARTGGTS